MYIQQKSKTVLVGIMSEYPLTLISDVGLISPENHIFKIGLKRAIIHTSKSSMLPCQQFNCFACRFLRVHMLLLRTKNFLNRLHRCAVWSKFLLYVYVLKT